MPPRNLSVILVSAVLSLLCYQRAEHSRMATVVADAMHLVDRYYLENVDRRQLFDDAMNGMIEHLDQYSSYIGPGQFEEMEASLDQEFGGIGVEVEKPDINQPLTVLSPIVGAPAYRAGMRGGDAILEIDGESTVGMALKEAMHRMRGKAGTSVQLRVRHAGANESIAVSLKREVIVVDSVLGDTRRQDGSWDFQLTQDPRIGYVRVTTFGKHTVEELKKALHNGEGEKCPFAALILDLRGNAGGLLDAAVEASDLFIDQGLIVSTRGRDGKIRESFSATPSVQIPLDLPLAVLVDKYSASASEIVAACLQDHHRAAIVGSRTWGKGTVQNIFELEGGRSALKLTTAAYSRPSGENIHRRKDVRDEDSWGVRPDRDLEVNLSDEELQKVFLQRRARDISLLPNGSPQVKTDANGAKPAEPVEDTQLRRAIDHIRKQLGGSA